MRFDKLKMASVAFLCCIGIQPYVVHVEAQAQIITIDGNFKDWSNALEQQQIIVNADFSAYAAFQDAEATYIHIVGSVNWSSLQGDSITYIDENEKEGKLNFSGINTDEFVLTIKDANYVNIANASIKGSLQNNKKEWEIKIPKTATGNISKLVFHGTMITDIPALKEDNAPPEQPGKPVELETPVPPDEPALGEGIDIDGYFGEWENLHHMDLSWQNSVIAKACAVLDKEDSICVHVGTPYREDRHLNLDNIRISINGSPATQIKLRQYNIDGSISSDPLGSIEQNNRYKMVAIIQEAGITYPLGDAYYTTKYTKNREDFEFCLSIKEVEKAMGLADGSIHSGSKIVFTFPSIGDGSIIIEGTTTGPLMGIVLCIGAVALGIGLKKRKEYKALK